MSAPRSEGGRFGCLSAIGSRDDDMIPAGSVRAAIEVVGTTLLDPSVTSPAVVEGAPRARMRLISSAGDGRTAAEPVLVSGVTAAVGRLEAAPADSSAERHQHMIPTITAPAPAVIASHKISPASLGRRSPTATVGMIPSCVVDFSRGR